MARKKLPDGRIEVRISLGKDPVTGAYPRAFRIFPAKTPKREIDAWEASERTKFNEGKFVAYSVKTVNELLDNWLETKDWKDKTRMDAEGLIKRHIRPVLGRKKVQEVTVQTAQEVSQKMQRAELADNYIRLAYSYLHGAFEYAVVMDLVQKNVVKQAKPYLAKGKKAAAITVFGSKELTEFLAKTEDYKTLYTFLATTGLRIGEALALEWKNVDLSKGELRVTSTLENVSSGFRVAKNPKTPYSLRTVILTPEVIALLKDRQSGDKFVFSGNGINYYQSATKEFKKFAPKGMVIHDLRHTACTLMLAGGVNIKVVSKMLGHSTVAFTLDRYAHLIPEMFEGLPAKLSEVFFATDLPIPESSTV